MVAAPTGKVLINELTITVQQAVSQHRKGEHIFTADLRYNLHKELLVLYQFFHAVNHISTVWILHTAEQSLDIVAVKNRHIHKRCLVNTHKRLVQSVDELLEALANVVVGILDNMT